MWDNCQRAKTHISLSLHTSGTGWQVSFDKTWWEILICHRQDSGLHEWAGQLIKLATELNNVTLSLQNTYNPLKLSKFACSNYIQACHSNTGLISPLTTLHDPWSFLRTDGCQHYHFYDNTISIKLLEMHRVRSNEYHCIIGSLFSKLDYR